MSGISKSDLDECSAKSLKALHQVADTARHREGPLRGSCGAAMARLMNVRKGRVLKNSFDARRQTLDQNFVLPEGGIYLAGTVAVALTALANGAVAWMIPALIVFGFGQGLSMTPLLNFTLGFTTEDKAGMAGGIISSMQQVGGAIGVAVVAIFCSQAKLSAVARQLNEQPRKT